MILKVDNAGITSDKTFVKMDPASWRKVLAITLDGVFNCTKVFVDDQAELGPGRQYHLGDRPDQQLRTGQLRRL